MDKKLSEMEDHSRKHCLVFYGLQVYQSASVEGAIIDFASRILGVTLESSDIMNAHYLPRSKFEQHNPIIVRFMKFDKRQEVYFASRGRKVAPFVRENFSPRSRSTRHILHLFRVEQQFPFPSPRGDQRDGARIVGSRLVYGSRRFEVDVSKRRVVEYARGRKVGSFPFPNMDEGEQETSYATMWPDSAATTVHLEKVTLQQPPPVPHPTVPVQPAPTTTTAISYARPTPVPIYTIATTATVPSTFTSAAPVTAPVTTTTVETVPTTNATDLVEPFSPTSEAGAEASEADTSMNGEEFFDAATPAVTTATGESTPLKRRRSEEGDGEDAANGMEPLGSVRKKSVHDVLMSNAPTRLGQRSPAPVHKSASKKKGKLDVSLETAMKIIEGAPKPPTTTLGNN